MNIVTRSAGEPVVRARLEPTERRSVTLDATGIGALADLLTLAERSDGARILVIEGTPGEFCRGMDLSFATTGTPDALRRCSESFVTCLDRLRRLPQAVVCVVDGDVTGGGVGLAAAADILLATERSSFTLPELSLGLLPAMVLPMLRERMSLQRARWMALSGARVSAGDAARYGLIDELIPAGRPVEGELRRVLRRLLRMRPEAVASWKRFVDDCAPLDRTAALDAGARRTRDDLAEPEVQGALRGLAEGEMPAWFRRDLSESAP